MPIREAVTKSETLLGGTKTAEVKQGVWTGLSWHPLADSCVVLHALPEEARSGHKWDMAWVWTIIHRKPPSMVLLGLNLITQLHPNALLIALYPRLLTSHHRRKPIRWPRLTSSSLSGDRLEPGLDLGTTGSASVVMLI